MREAGTAKQVSPCTLSRLPGSSSGQTAPPRRSPASTGRSGEPRAARLCPRVSTGVSATRHSWPDTEPASGANPRGELGKAAAAPATFYLPGCSWGGATHPSQHHQLTWAKRTQCLLEPASASAPAACQVASLAFTSFFTSLAMTGRALPAFCKGSVSYSPHPACRVTSSSAAPGRAASPRTVTTGEGCCPRPRLPDFHHFLLNYYTSPPWCPSILSAHRLYCISRWCLPCRNNRGGVPPGCCGCLTELLCSSLGSGQVGRTDRSVRGSP